MCPSPPLSGPAACRKERESLVERSWIDYIQSRLNGQSETLSSLAVQIDRCVHREQYGRKNRKNWLVIRWFAPIQMVLRNVVTDRAQVFALYLYSVVLQQGDVRGKSKGNPSRTAHNWS